MWLSTPGSSAESVGSRPTCPGCSLRSLGFREGPVKREPHRPGSRGVFSRVGTYRERNKDVCRDMNIHMRKSMREREREREREAERDIDACTY